MFDQYSLFFLILLSLVIFGVGFLTGGFTKKRLRYKWKVRQNKGEAVVRKAIASNFKSPNFHLLNDITLPFQDGTTQIDHILVSTKGVFVIETKNYSGWIFGNKKSAQWMQVIYRVKNRFQNPIRQNYKHVKAIQNLADFLPKKQIHSIVVFTGSAEFKTPIPKGVMYQSQLVNYLNSFQDDVVSFEHLEFCVGRLECKRYEATKRTDLEHRAYLAKKFG